MIITIGRYKFQHGSSSKKVKLCPLCLDDISKTTEHSCLRKMSIVVKKPDYGLIRIPRSEPVIERMLKMTHNRKDTSRSFIVMYVNNTLVGYKSPQSMKFIKGFSKKNYIKILEKYEPKRNQRSSSKGYKAIKRV